MSRHGYTDECDDHWVTIRWRGAVASAIRGKRGQALMRDLLDALDAMPVKRLIQCKLQDEDGEVCALGALGVKRGLDMKDIDPEDLDDVAGAFGCARAMAAEIEYMNDEFYDDKSPEQLWNAMRAWVEDQIAKPPPSPADPARDAGRSEQ